MFGFASAQSHYNNREQARNRGSPENSAHANASKKQQCDRWAEDGARGIHGLQQTEGRADFFFFDRLGQHHIARRAANALGGAVGKADEQHLPPVGGDGKNGLHNICQRVAKDDDGFAARAAVGEVSGKEFGEGSHALRDAFDYSQLRRTRSDAQQKRRQNPIRHFAGSIVQQAGDAEDGDVPA